MTKLLSSVVLILWHRSIFWGNEQRKRAAYRCDIMPDYMLPKAVLYPFLMFCIGLIHLSSSAVSVATENSLADLSQPLFLRQHKLDVYTVAFSPNGRYLASGSLDRSILIWDLKERQVIKTLKGHSHWVTALSFSPNGRYLISGSVDHTLRRWDLNKEDSVEVLKGHEKPITTLTCSADSRYIASGSLDKTIRIWDLNNTKSLAVITQPTAVAALRFSPTGLWLASALMDQPEIQLWQWQKSALTQHSSFTGATAENNVLAFSPAGDYLAAGSLDKNIRIWRTATRALRWTLKGHLASVWSLAYSPDGNYLVSGSIGDKTMRFWDTQKGQDVYTLLLKANNTYSLAFSPDGKTLASAHEDKTIALWQEPSQWAKSSKPDALVHNVPLLSVAGYGLNEPQNGIPDAGEELEIGILIRNKGTAKAPAPHIGILVPLTEITVTPQKWDLAALRPDEYALIKLKLKTDAKINVTRIPLEIQLQATPQATLLREKVTLTLGQPAPSLDGLTDILGSQPHPLYPQKLLWWLTDWL